MAEPVVRVLGIAPYDGMRAAMQKAAESCPGIHLDAYTGDLEEGADLVRRFQYEDYDAIISRGGTAELISRLSELPVIFIPISVYDILRAIRLVENYSSTYAIVGFSTITEPAHILCDLLQREMDIMTIHDAGEVESTLKKLHQRGCRTVVSDMVTHTAARRLGMDAFLITSGTESIRQALEQAQTLGSSFRTLRRENIFLKSLLQNSDDLAAVYDQKGELVYSTGETPSKALSELLTSLIPQVSDHHVSSFYHSRNHELYRINAHCLKNGGELSYIFHYRLSQVSIRPERAGIRSHSEAECRDMFLDSFFSLSGAMGELEDRVASIAATAQPVMVLGEKGTGKEQIARVIYLRSERKRKPFIAIDCALMTDKSWDFLFSHEASPINDMGNTVYFQHIEAIPEARLSELIQVITDTNMTKRVRLIFSCDYDDASQLPRAADGLISKLSCLTLTMPTLRSRQDEIPSLASIYLSNLNVELGKQIIGFDPQAMELLRLYEWPNNYTQFKQILGELATLTEGSYIRSSAVMDILTRERDMRSQRPLQSMADDHDICTLEETELRAVAAALRYCRGNQTEAARVLGISRTTMWRYIKKLEGGEALHKEEDT